MALVLNDEQKMLRDSAQSFLAERAPVAHLRKLRDGNDSLAYSRELWSQFAEQGYCSILIPERHGGLGLGVFEAGLISENIGHTLTPAPFISSAVLAPWLIAHAGSDAQKTRLLPLIGKGQRLLALAIDERSKHNPTAIATQATAKGGTSGAAASGYVINGSKTFVLDAYGADELIVVARTAANALSLFLVDAKLRGVTIERTAMVDSNNAARVRFDQVTVGADALIGKLGEGAALLDQALDVGRVVVAAQLLGIADEVFARTMDYIKQRKQFDKIIGEFQALQHRAAELFCDIEITRAIVLKALQAVDRDVASAALTVAQAKARACVTANRAVQESVQMHGGIGMTDAIDIGLFMKRARALIELFGDAGFHADRVAKMGSY